MLMDIIMESLMSMDENTLDSVLESCSAEEIDIIDSAIEAGYSNIKRIVGNIVNGPEKTNQRILNKGRSAEKETASKKRDSDIAQAYNEDRRALDANDEIKKLKTHQRMQEDAIKDNIRKLKDARDEHDDQRYEIQADQLKRQLEKVNDLKAKIGELSSKTDPTAEERYNNKVNAAKVRYNETIGSINAANAADATKNNNSRSAQLGRNIRGTVGKIRSAANSAVAKISSKN